MKNILLVILLSFWAIQPLFLDGFFPMHDDTQPARVFEMAKGLSSGQFPVRWVGELGYGYGYPLFNFYAPLPYYLGGIFNLVGFEIILATKLMFAMGILLAGLSMYFLGKELVGKMGGVAASLLYLYAPYHAVNIYIRGAVGEFYAYGFLPLILLGIIKITRSFALKRQARTIRQGILTGTIGFAGVLLSHNILGMISGYFFVGGLITYLLYLFLFKKRLSIFSLLLSIFILGLGLSASFTLPALFEKKYTRVEELTEGGSNFRQHFVYLDQLWQSPWGFAGSALGRDDGMSFKLGKLHLILSLLGVMAGIYLYKNKQLTSFQFSVFSFQFLIFIISIFLMLSPSYFLWEKLPGFPFIQYPWRFLNFAIFSLTILSLSLFLLIKRRAQILLSLLIIGLTLWFNIKYFAPKEYLKIAAEDYISGFNLRFKISKISDEYLPKEFRLPKKGEEVAWQGLVSTSEVKVELISDTPTEKKYKIDAVTPSRLLTNITYFPGWKAYLDGRERAISKKLGRIEIAVPKEEHSLTFQFTNTPIRWLGNTISLFSLFLLVYVSLLWPKNTLLR